MNNNENEIIDIKLEDAVIGECIVDHIGFDKVLEYGINEDYFTQPQAKELFKAMAELNASGKSVDLITIGNTLRDKSKKDVFNYALKTTNGVFSAANIQSHLYYLSQLYYRRVCADMGQKIYMSTVYDEQEHMIAKLQEFIDTMQIKRYKSDGNAIGFYLQKSYEAYNRRAELLAKGEIGGITTGLKDLDNLNGGWQDSNLIVLAGRPGMGKTAMAIHFAMSAARKGKKVQIYALEMTGKEIADRMVTAVCGINADNFRKGIITEYEIDEFNVASKILEGLPIYIDDTPVQTTAYIRANAKGKKKIGMCDLVIVDYLQLVDMTTGNKNMNREQQVAKTSREFKLMAKELDVPVIVLSQLSRSVEGRSNKRPMLSDLRDSGAIEQDADQVLFVYRPEYYDSMEGEETISAPQEGGVAELIVSKLRSGSVGSVKFTHNASLTKIGDLSEDATTYFDQGADLPY